MWKNATLPISCFIGLRCLQTRHLPPPRRRPRSCHPPPHPPSPNLLRVLRVLARCRHHRRHLFPHRSPVTQGDDDDAHPNSMASLAAHRRRVGHTERARSDCRRAGVDEHRLTPDGSSREVQESHHQTRRLPGRQSRLALHHFKGSRQ